jgi:hypothetical protein
MIGVRGHEIQSPDSVHAFEVMVRQSQALVLASRLQFRFELSHGLAQSPECVVLSGLHATWQRAE